MVASMSFETVRLVGAFMGGCLLGCLLTYKLLMRKMGEERRLAAVQAQPRLDSTVARLQGRQGQPWMRRLRPKDV
jgi:hypothetical protein